MKNERRVVKYNEQMILLMSINWIRKLFKTSNGPKVIHYLEAAPSKQSDKRGHTPSTVSVQSHQYLIKDEFAIWWLGMMNPGSTTKSARCMIWNVSCSIRFKYLN